ncbi:hypothetical protein [Terrabacter terrae]
MSSIQTAVQKGRSTITLDTAMIIVGIAIFVAGLASGFVGTAPNCGSAFSTSNSIFGPSSCGALEAEARREAIQLMVLGGAWTVLSLVAAFGTPRSTSK